MINLCKGLLRGRLKREGDKMEYKLTKIITDPVRGKYLEITADEDGANIKIIAFNPKGIEETITKDLIKSWGKTT